MPHDGQRLPPADAGPLLEWLLRVLQPMSRTRIKQLLKYGQITVNGTPISQFDHPLAAGDVVRVQPRSPTADLQVVLAQVGMPIVFMDDHLVAVNKPEGLLSVASEREKARTSFVVLKEAMEQHRLGRPFVVHRLDRETSGLLLFARTDNIRTQLQEAWDTLQKTYHAWVEGEPPAETGTIENYLIEGADYRVSATSSDRPHAKHAITRYRIRQRSGPWTLVEVDLITGRKHQIRVHLAGLGCPIVGDRFYHATTDPLARLGLHAWRMQFHHPATAAMLTLEAPIPSAFKPSAT